MPAARATGAYGELRYGLIHALSKSGTLDVLALDIKPVDESLRPLCAACIVGDVLDARLLERLVSEFEIDVIFHLAALLSTRAEFTPKTAHEVNVQGTLNLLELAIEQSRWHGREVRFLFPSSIAAYGLAPRLKMEVGSVKEDEYNFPTTMYGCNKLYCEHLGNYYAQYFQQLAVDRLRTGVDFRAIRFPGLLSAFTVPSGGTSDFAPEMLHAAAQGQAYECFVRADTRIPFMTMPDAVQALLRLMDAPKSELTRHVYNIGAFNPSAEEFAAHVREHFPRAELSFSVDERRQGIVDTWPTEVDDNAARTDWGFKPEHDLKTAFEKYLVPNIAARYACASCTGPGPSPRQAHGQTPPPRRRAPYQRRRRGLHPHRPLSGHARIQRIRDRL